MADGLAAEQDHAWGGCVQQAFGDELFGVGGGDLDDVDALGVEVADEGGGVTADLVADQVQFVAGDQPEQAVPGGVEAERGGERDAAAAVLALGGADRAGRAAVRGEECGDRAVAHHDSLGAAGGARGVDHVGGVGGGRAGRRVLRGAGVGAVLRGGGQDGQAGEEFGQGPSVAGHGQGGPGVGEHGRGAVGRVAGVQREGGRAGLEYGEQGDHGLRRARQGEGDDRFRAGSRGRQAVGEVVGAGVQLGPGEPGVSGDQGGRVGGAGRLGLEGGGQQLCGRRRLIRGRDECGAFLRREQVDPADGEVGAGRDRREQPAEADGDGLRGLAVEEVGGEVDRALQPGRRAVGVEGLAQGDGQVELGRVSADRFDGGRQAGQVERGACRAGGPGRALEQQHDLEERVAGEGAGRVEFLDDALEGHVLVGVGVQLGLPDPAEEFGEGGVAGGVGAQDEGVDEEADEVVEGLVRAAGDDRADRDVGAGPEPGQQRRQSGLEGHEHRDAVLAGQSRQRPVQCAVEREDDPVAAVAAVRAPGAVHGERQLLGKSGQGFAPVGELAGGRALLVVLVAEQLALPQGVVRVLHRQRLPVGRRAVAAGGVGGGEVAQQRVHGPAVAGDVVQDEDEE
ncbi:hypothetical protein SIN09_30740, partial [Streptomyces sp. F8]|nr:hypothetical protein [Streptomyces sp. F8]